MFMKMIQGKEKFTAWKKWFRLYCTGKYFLYNFLHELLNDENGTYSRYIIWKNYFCGIFKIVDPAGLAKLWGAKKHHPKMNYDKLSRSLRYYYKSNKLRKVQGERQTYQFIYTDDKKLEESH